MTLNVKALKPLYDAVVVTSAVIKQISEGEKFESDILNGLVKSMRSAIRMAEEDE